MSGDEVRGEKSSSVMEMDEGEKSMSMLSDNGGYDGARETERDGEGREGGVAKVTGRRGIGKEVLGGKEGWSG